MAEDFEVEEGEEVVRRTIVGGRPRAREARRIRVPIGLEKLLCRAASDRSFRDALLADRERAVDDAGYALQGSERATLASVPPALLATMIDRIDVQRHGQGRFMRGVMAAALATLATTVTDGCTGIEPDMPEGVDARNDAVLVQDIEPSRGISPDLPDTVPTPADDVFVVPGEDQSVLPEPDVLEIDIAVPMPAGILPDAE